MVTEMPTATRHDTSAPTITVSRVYRLIRPGAIHSPPEGTGCDPGCDAEEDGPADGGKPEIPERHWMTCSMPGTLQQSAPIASNGILGPPDGGAKYRPA